jgi:hypothetical protein
VYSDAYASIAPSIKSSVSDHIKNQHVSDDCHALIKKMEREHDIPDNLLAAVATVESRKKPWAVNARGRSRFFSTKEDALTFIHQQKNKGVKHIYVGCMQICLKTHGPKFKDIEHLLTPYHNIEYAAKLLKKLYQRFGSWESAVMHYNASSRRESYRNRVVALWNNPQALSMQQTSCISDAAGVHPHEREKPKHVRIAFGPGVGVR